MLDGLLQNTDMESNTILYDSDAPTQTSTVANCSNWTGCPLDEADYIRSYLGWRYRGLCETVVLTTVYATILLTGVIGNASTCVVIATNRAMHSPTNFYLLSLAVSDVLTLCLGTTLHFPTLSTVMSKTLVLAVAVALLA